ncbi:MAG: aldo/keto reductase [Bdellovibrionales bacterium]|nr:aldo/keto reductase [Bdellovibrionales bacterium]
MSLELRTRLSIPLGFGTYRAGTDRPEHAQALGLALARGVALIDTSTNYLGGDAERLVGKALSELRAGGRNAPFVVTKAGYVQGENHALAEKAEAEGRPFPGMVKVQRGLWHCVSPEWIEDQLTRSLQRLGAARVDALLLHNPEYFLKAGGSAEEYYARMGRAFLHLEREIERGRIGCYGVSSNTFGAALDDRERTSLPLVLEQAGRVGKGFRVIQFPLNLVEPGTALEVGEEGLTVLGLAKREGLLALANRPLNGVAQDRLLRLVDFRKFDERVTEASLLQLIRERVTVARDVEDDVPPHPDAPIQRMAWARALEEGFYQVGDLLQWREILAWKIGPALSHFQERLSAHADPELREWYCRYQEVTLPMLDAVTGLMEFRAGAVSRRIAETLDELEPALRSSATLSQKSVRMLRSLEGVDAALVGMRRPEYVTDLLDGDLSPLPPGRSEAILRELRARWA